MTKPSNTNVSAIPEPQMADKPELTHSDAMADVNETTTPERTFTQAELDRIVKERLERERSKYADYATLKEAAARLKEIEDAQKTELEKLQERLQQVEQQAMQTAVENKRLKLTAKIASIAGQLGAIDPYDANFEIATQSIDPDSDGADEQIKSSIEALKAQRPYLFARAQTQVEPFNPDSGPGTPQRETDDQRRARIFGGGGDIWDTKVAGKLGGGVIFGPGLEQ